MVRTLISAATAAGRYLRNNPGELGRAALGALGLRFGLPLAALRWAADTLGNNPAVTDIVIEAVPPGLRVGGSLTLMDTGVQASAVIYIDAIRLSGEEAVMDIRLEQIEVVPTSPRKTQLSALLKTGALDLSRPGDLLANLPGIPPLIRDAEGNRFTIDLMCLPQLKANASIRDALALVTSVVTLRAIETDAHHLDVVLGLLPRGYAEAQHQVQKNVVRLALARGLLPATS
ncbi:MAG: hypothetical protein H6713_28685 [Myxococcales bacterium]|nr:hypothetical protein [Myxococcales bacterium]MCB9753939.1 hypothetical protein [Myxococcales bacterium]